MDRCTDWAQLKQFYFLPWGPVKNADNRTSDTSQHIPATTSPPAHLSRVLSICYMIPIHLFNLHWMWIKHYGNHWEFAGWHFESIMLSSRDDCNLTRNMERFPAMSTLPLKSKDKESRETFGRVKIFLELLKLHCTSRCLESKVNYLVIFWCAPINYL